MGMQVQTHTRTHTARMQRHMDTDTQASANTDRHTGHRSKHTCPVTHLMSVFDEGGKLSRFGSGSQSQTEQCARGWAIADSEI